MMQNTELLEFFEECYRRARGSRRDIRRDDRLYEDLGVDSLLANELLVALEDRYELRLLHDPRVWQVTTVGQLLDLIGELELEQRAAPAGSGS
jgi:acyl carrier protein